MIMNEHEFQIAHKETDRNYLIVTKHE